MAWSGARPVQWLLDNMSLDERWCLIHCTHMTPDESAGLGADPAPSPACARSPRPISATAFSRRRALRAAGGRFAVGTDSNVRIALNEELRTLEYGQRLREQKRNRLGPVGASTGRHLFDTARRGGAQALGIASGGLAVGQTADIVMLDETHPALVGRDGDHDHRTRGSSPPATARCATCSRGGQRVVADGRHVRRDEIRRRFAVTMRRLLEDA